MNRRSNFKLKVKLKIIKVIENRYNKEKIETIFTGKKRKLENDTEIVISKRKKKERWKKPFKLFDRMIKLSSLLLFQVICRRRKKKKRIF